MTTESKYPPFRSKLDAFSARLAHIVKNYAENDPETNAFYAKVLFLGINRYINGNPTFINWDIIYVYKALQEAGVDARLHDPHIRPNMALSQGIWLGRRSKEDNWSNSYHALILSCPHLFYIQNMTKLGHLLVPSKATVLIDIWGMFTKIASIGDNISVYNMIDSAKECEVSPAIDLGLPLKRLN